MKICVQVLTDDGGYVDIYPKIKVNKYFNHLGHKFAIHKTPIAVDKGGVITLAYDFSVSHFEAGFAICKGSYTMRSAQAKAVEIIDRNGIEKLESFLQTVKKINGANK